MEYYRFTGEIRKNFWEFKNNLYNGLSNEDRLVDSIIVSRLDPPCSKPTHKLPDFRLDIDFSENGVLVNGKDFITAQDQNIDPTQDSYTFQGEWFTVEKKNKTTLNITMDENRGETERKIIIHLQAGNYFDRVSITQEGEWVCC